MGVVLIGGGARSGKSRFAQAYGEKHFQRRAYVVTAQARDQEMEERIRRHQAQRGRQWTTIEEPLDIAGAMTREANRFEVFVVDCLTLWLSNVLLNTERDARAEIESLKHHTQQWRGPTLVLVTNEVGCGIVPENALAREYRDLAGELNQVMAQIADEIYWMVFGVPMAVKGCGTQPLS